MSYDLQILRFHDLSIDLFYEIVAQRIAVFVVEQDCPYQEIDELDNHCQTRHLVIGSDSRLAAYARCLAPGTSYTDYASIGRVLVPQEERGKGLANRLMVSAIECCQQLWPQHDIKISAQCYLVEFYLSLGFEQVGESYLEDGIPHQAMVLQQIKRPTN